MSGIESTLDLQREFFARGVTKDLAFRREKLLLLKQAIKEYEPEILDALHADLNKTAFEGYMTELGMVYGELSFVLKRLERWARPKKVRTSLANFPAKSYILREPYGNVLIMSPWNYPFQLTIVPLIGALAAGNTAVVKPSNYAPATSAVIKKLLTGIYEPAYVSVVEGGREVNQDLLKQKFDYIFFTGSVSVGRAVMAAAAAHLTPVTLELGGKSPCIVDKTADIGLAARRIAWGKFLNSGQTCVAPDYLLVHESVKDELIAALKKSVYAFYGDAPHENPDYPKIISEKHFTRLTGLMTGGTVVSGGRISAETRQIEPTVLDCVAPDSPVMSEEIFGPILPVLTFTELSDAVEFVRGRPRPLALYFFTGNKKDAKFVTETLSFGGGCINDTVTHLASSHMPFGGVGDSGMGGYHGEASFRTFSHSKSILAKGRRELKLRYFPKGEKVNMLRRFMR